MRLPRKIILNRSPRKYLKQGLTYCGGYTIKGVLSAFGKDDKGHPKNYLPFKGLFFGIATTGIIAKALAKYGIKSKPMLSKNNDNKLEIIKKELSKGNPVVLRIGNGYTLDGKYNRLKGFFVGHWISIWGYDEDVKVFYIYDSAAPSMHRLPVGNAERSYSDVLRDWKFGNRLGFGHGSYHYIKVEAE